MTDYKAAVLEELITGGAIAGVLAAATEVSRSFGIHSTNGMLVVSIVAIVCHIVWQYRQEPNTQHTVPKQLSRLAVNVGLFMVGLLAYGVPAQHMDRMTTKSLGVKLLVNYSSNLVMYSFTRGIFNMLLLIPAVLNSYDH